SRVPMLCTSRSENRLACWCDRALLGWLYEPLGIRAPVSIEGVWHRAQPTPANTWLPRCEEAVAGAGVGGAIRRMKLANASTSDSTGGGAGGVAGEGESRGAV